MNESALKNKTAYDYLAFIISTLLSPYVTAAIFIVVIVYRYAENLAQFLPWVLTFFVFGLVFPGIYVLWLMENKRIRSIHISEHKERKLPFLLLAISASIGACLLWVLGAAKPVVMVATVYAVNTVVIALITIYWKISVHTAIFSAITTMLIVIFGTQFGYLYLFLIPLAWSRIHRHRHTVAQVTAGSLMAFLLTASVFWLYGYL